MKSKPRVPRATTSAALPHRLCNERNIHAARFAFFAAKAHLNANPRQNEAAAGSGRAKNKSGMTEREKKRRKIKLIRDATSLRRIVWEIRMRWEGKSAPGMKFWRGDGATTAAWWRKIARAWTFARKYEILDFSRPVQRERMRGRFDQRCWKFQISAWNRSRFVVEFEGQCIENENQ